MKEFNSSAMRYVHSVSDNPEMAHNKILHRIKSNSKVLEFGPASGAMTKVLKEKMNCEVSIVEIDAGCFEVAKKYASNGFCGDLESFEWKTVFSENKYDYITFVDVLEHLRNPEKAIREASDLLNEDGSMLISIPNVAHNSVIIQMINNRFIYQETGILDYTHLHHFTFCELEKLCRNAGMVPVFMDATYIAVGKNEFDVSYADVDPEIAEILKKRPFGEVYQHIFEVKKEKYVDNNDVVIVNNLGSPKDYLEKCDICIAEGKEDVFSFIENNPNLVFGTNDEVARMRLEINDLYAAIPEIDNSRALLERIHDSYEEIRKKNSHIRKLDEELSIKNNRIVALQDEVVERNSHISKLDEEMENKNKEIYEKNKVIKDKDKEIEDQNKEIEDQNKEIEDKNKEIEDKNKEIENRDKQFSKAISDWNEEKVQLVQTIKNKEGHIELLLEVEREYEREKQTKSYRLALIFRKIFNFFFPKNSRRLFFARILVKTVRHPILMSKMLSPKRIKNYFKYVKTEGMEGVNRRYKEALDDTRHQMYPAENLKVEKVETANAESLKIEDFEKLELPLVMNKPVVSIVIPVYNEFNYTYNCIKSIIENSGDVSYEVIIANDCSTDITTSIEKIVENVRVITTKKNVRFLLNCNNAAKFAKGNYILFLNNDTQVQENWLKPLVDLIESDDRIGMVGSKLVYPDGRLQEAGGILWKDGSAWNYGHLANSEDPEYNYVKEVDYISGAAIMIKRDLWKEIGGFDQAFVPAYYEDTDLAFEVRKHGYKVLYQPASVVVHFEGVSNGTDTSSGLKAYQVANQKKFFEKWKDTLEKDHFPNAENVYLAKDRGQLRKQILVVDHYVPHYDKDAGGRCTYMYLKLFVKMGFKVTFIGDNFYKHEPYTTELNQIGIEVLYGNYYYNNWQDWLKDNLKYFDYVYLQRPHISIKYIDIVKKYGHAKILYFAHDLHHIREMREYELTGNAEKKESAEKWKTIEYELFDKADVGHVVGSYEQGIMQKAFPNKPIRNIPLYIYENVADGIQKDFAQRNDLLYVGGFGHPPNEDAVLWFAKEVFPTVIKRYPNIKWHVVGSKAPEAILALASDNIIIEGFLSDEDLEKLYRSCRMAIVPLRYGAGVKGKVVESAYYQIPLVTTSIGAEGIDTTMGNMVIHDNAKEMAESICSLYDDFDALKKMSDGGAELIHKHYTLEEAERVLKQDVEC